MAARAAHWLARPPLPSRYSFARVGCTTTTLTPTPPQRRAYLKTALDAGPQRRFLETAAASGARAVSTHWRAVGPEHVADAHSRGLRIFSWHEGYELTPEKLRAGLDILITDFPQEARAAYASVPAGA